MEVWNNSLLISSGSWDDVGRATESVRAAVLEQLVEQRAIPASLGLAYWTHLRSSGLFGVGLFYTQQSPLFVVRLFRDPSMRSLQAPTLSWPNWRTDVSWSGGLRHRASSILRLVVSQWRRLKAWLLRPVRTAVRAERTRLVEARGRATRAIGSLLRTDGTPQEQIKQLAEVAGLDAAVLDLSTPASSLQALQAVLDNATSTHVASLGGTSALPPAWVRWWPAAALVAVAAYYLTGSWDEVLHWFKTSVLETVQAFWQNWLVEPLYQIYLTIRHDPNGQVALIAKESLTSDIASLIDMVVAFARDTNPSLTPEDLDAVRTEARNGNVSPVMAAYNRQLEAPLKNLVTGKLIRTLLIQVQKSKVDAEVAISGIDQLLGSQQLVFGSLAALPALGLVAYLWRQLRSSLSQSAMRGEDVLVRLGSIDEVVQSASVDGAALGDETLGMVYCEVMLIKRASGKARSEGRKQFLKSVDRLLDVAVTTRDTKAVLGTLDRIYMRFSYYT